MGKSYTPIYIVTIEIDNPDMLYFTPSACSAWRVRGSRNPPLKGHGAPTLANLHNYVVALELSCLPNGVNAHLGCITISNAKIVRQSDDEIMAEWNRAEHINFGDDNRLIERD
jgi:hypothetical protein